MGERNGDAAACPWQESRCSEWVKKELTYEEGQLCKLAAALVTVGLSHC
jgi:hypothetical protein